MDEYRRRGNLVDIFYSGAKINPHTDVSFAYLVNTALIPLGDLTRYNLMNVNAVLGGPFYDGSNNILPIQTFDLSSAIAQPVPEPSIALLFASGLGFAGFAARRRKARSAA